MRSTLLTILFFSHLLVPASAQENFPMNITLEPVLVEGFNGLQSYAWARSGNRILLIGGRTDGLHKKQPFAAFHKNGNNTELIVLEPVTGKIWKKPVSLLPASLAEQLQSTNMEFHQEGNVLVLAGGYGYSETAKDHITHPYLTRIQVRETIEAVMRNKDLSPFISQLRDERMAVSGGRMQQLEGAYYLVGGHRFDGRYNPHGPDHGPGFSQQYSNQVRIFRLSATGQDLAILSYTSFTDTALFHRRDANLLPQYDEKGKKMLTLFAGVFKPDKDLPFTNLTDINSSGYREIRGFSQQYAHYHTACLPLFDAGSQTTWSVFFGGIAQHYSDSSGKLQTDNNVPFIRHISAISRKAGAVSEILLPEQFSGYFGAAAEFIPEPGSLFNEDGFLLVAKAGRENKLAGYIIGGIDSRGPNIFWGNQPDGSRASPVIWKVFIKKK